MIRASIVIALLATVSIATAADKTSPVATTEMKGDRKVASVGADELAAKALDYADSMARSMNGETANCELNVYETDLIGLIRSALGYKENLAFPASVERLLARNVSFRMMKSGKGHATKEAELVKYLAGSRMWISGVTSMFNGSIDFTADGKFVINQGVWDSAKDDYGHKTYGGTWKIMKDTDVAGLSLIMTEVRKPGKGGTFTRAYRPTYVDGHFGFARADRLIKKDIENVSQLAFSSEAFGNCEH
ncbi:MAG: hypothetical protein V4692_05290 [Bdellovibrionota bacterium]